MVCKPLRLLATQYVTYYRKSVWKSTFNRATAQYAKDREETSAVGAAASRHATDPNRQTWNDETNDRQINPKAEMWSQARSGSEYGITYPPGKVPLYPDINARQIASVAIANTRYANTVNIACCRDQDDRKRRQRELL